MGVSKPLLLSWMVAVTAVTGSIFLSEVLGFLPCNLCWWQRAAMFPLAVILTVGLLRRDRGVWWYALPLGVAGIVLASYNELLQLGVLPESLVCSAAVACSTKYINLLGFITIPLLSLTAFSVITGLGLWGVSREHRS